MTERNAMPGSYLFEKNIDWSVEKNWSFEIV